jgi:GTP cyclohydrolase I
VKDVVEGHYIGNTTPSKRIEPSMVKPYPSISAFLDQVTDEELAEELLVRCAGLDPKNPQEVRTAERYVRALKDMTTPEEFAFTTFDAESDEMVTMYNIPFSSLCRHHVLPFKGVAHVAYVPKKEWAGASKLARTVQWYSRFLQTQEEMTSGIADKLIANLDPVGVGVVLEAEHFCMSLRGPKTYGTRMRTARMTGCFGDHDKTAKAEFLAGINGGH